MKYRLLSVRTVLIALTVTMGLNTLAQEPVTPNASSEVKALLKYMQSLSGKYTLAGQHNFPASGDRNTRFFTDYAGKTPVVWSQDFGFSAAGDKDSYLSRPAIIEEAIKQHKKGAIVNLCWHAVPPTAEEPVTFQPLPGADSTAPLASVQGRLTEKQYRDILTPGTNLYKQWAKQVDVIAGFLKQLQDARVPVLWRPYHEMNGDWFWWGGRYEGKYTTAALYKQIFDRLVNFHKLNNLVWIWSVDRPTKPGREFVNYYPGTKYLDILAIDIYGNDFNQSYYEGLKALSEGKPVTLAEVGNPPSMEVIGKQPDWIYWVIWAGGVRGTSLADYEKITSDKRIVFMEDQSFVNGTREFRIASGLEPLTFNREADFTGEWMLNDCESIIPQAMGPVSTPYKLNIAQKGNLLDVKSYSLSEWSDDEIMDQNITLDGNDNRSKGFMDSERVQNAYWSPARDTLTILSRVSLNFNKKEVEMKSVEVWSLKKKGKKLVMRQTADGFMGSEKRISTLVYDKQ